MKSMSSSVVGTERMSDGQCMEILSWGVVRLGFREGTGCDGT